MAAEFDFEQDVVRLLPRIDDDTINAEMGGFSKVSDHKRRKVVCKHWLLGLCHNGMRCDYLHRLDRNKMPPCKHGKLCKIKNCPLKHVAEEELEVCAYYKQGFCFSGPKCGRRHEKRTPEECPVEATFDQGTSAPVPGSKKPKLGQPNENFKVTLCNHWLSSGDCPFGDDCHYAHGEEEINLGQQANFDFLQDGDIYDPTRGLMGVPLELPFPENSRCQYYILQSPDLRSLAISKKRGIWAIPSRMTAEMNAARKASDHVVIFFCVRPLRGIYGVAKLTGHIPPSNAPISPEFSVQWLRNCRLSLATVAQLKLGNSGMFVGRSSMDGRFDNRVGLELLLTVFRKPPWDWSLEMEAAERNIRITDKQNGGPIGEYYPSAGPASSYLPENVLFAPDWIDRATLPINEKGVLINHRYGHQSHSNQDVSAAPDFYNGADPGFIVCGTTVQVEEMLGRMLIGLPPLFQDLAINPSSPVFIFDTTTSIMLGIFFLTTPVQQGIDPTAFWDGVGSSLPIQARFRPAFEGYPPIQISIRDPELLACLGISVQSMGLIGPNETKLVANLFAKRMRFLQSSARQNGNGNRRPPFRRF